MASDHSRPRIALLRHSDRWQSREPRSSRLVYPFLISILVVLTLSSVISCSGDSAGQSPQPTIDPEPPISESQAIKIAREQLESVLDEIDAYGYGDARIRIGQMRLRKLQDLTESDLYSEESPRLDRQIWAVQIDAAWEHADIPYAIPFGYGVVGIDAINGDIWLRGRFDREILVE